jgi:SAM-dependent methyltransferase
VDRATQLALNALNRDFYAQQARPWTESRRYPWPGFTRIVELAPRRADGPMRVLDVGSGDGRFALYLDEKLRGGVAYVGLDASAELTEHARGRALGAAFRFEIADFVNLPPTAAGPAGPFELVVLLGVLHHVPGFDQRCELLRALAGRLAPGGVFAFTLWRLPEDARFESRVIPWPAYNASAARPIAEDQLEPGDTLLRFGPTHAPRYCHFPDPVETERLIACSELQPIARFRADGRGEQLNEYVVLRA